MSYRLRLTRKGVILLVIGLILLIGGTIFAVWAVNRAGQVAPDDTRADSCDDPRFENIDECIASCEEGCPGSSDPAACIAGCPEACDALCNNGGGGGGTDPTPDCGGLNQGCCGDTGNYSCDEGSGLECCRGSCVGPNNPACGNGGADCSACEATCGMLSCSTDCGPGVNPVDNCGAGNNTFVCDGQSNSACNENLASYNVGLSNNSGSVDPSDPDYWCTTVQLDTYWSGGSNAQVVFIGDGGDYCDDEDSSCINGLDWVCGPECGDGVVEEGEACDDGNSNNNDSCRNDCTLTLCGDGIVDTGEQCDDGNNSDTDSCRNNCTVPACGDGTIDPDEECDPEASTDSCDFGACKVDCSCPAEPAPSCGDGDVDPGEECDPEASSNSCTFGECAVDCSCPGANPTWTIVKSSAPSCNEGKGPVSAQVAYTITVQNIGTTAGELDKIVDTLDPEVQSDWLDLDSVDPSASIVGGVVTWDLVDDDQTFEPDEEMVFSYTLNIPSDSFGEYTNSVEGFVLDEGEENFTTENTTIVTCEIPTTGLFDSTLSKVIASIVLLILGVTYLFFDRFDRGAVELIEGVEHSVSTQGRVERNRRKFEKRL